MKLITSYCKHGNIRVWEKTYKNLEHLYENELQTNTYILCDKCLSEKILDNDITFNHDKLIKDLAKIKKPGEVLLKSRHPQLLLAIYKFTEQFIDINWFMRLYLFKHKHTELPKCQYCGKYIKNLYKKDIVPNFCKK